MSEVFTIERNGKVIEVNKLIFDAYCKLGTDSECQLFFDNILNMRALPAGTKPNEPAVADSVAATLAQRGSRYGDFTDHARVCQGSKNTANMAMPIESGRGFAYLSDVQKQAIEVIFDKIARILTGDPNYDDNWHDIQGYAKLVEDRLPKESK